MVYGVLWLDSYKGFDSWICQALITLKMLWLQKCHDGVGNVSSLF